MFMFACVVHFSNLLLDEGAFPRHAGFTTLHAGQEVVKLATSQGGGGGIIQVLHNSCAVLSFKRFRDCVGICAEKRTALCKCTAG